jgi:hypothetical protein
MPTFLLCLPLLILTSCKPEPVGEADTGEVFRDVPSSWTALGCDVDGVYLLRDIEEQVGPAPWLFEAWILDQESWSPESYEVQDQIVQVWWSFEPDAGECGLWALSLWG